MVSQILPLTEYSTVQCPHCWERIDIAVNLSQDSQDYIEDCPLCAFPMLMHVQIKDALLMRLEAE